MVNLSYGRSGEGKVSRKKKKFVGASRREKQTTMVAPKKEKNDRPDGLSAFGKGTGCKQTKGQVRRGGLLEAGEAGRGIWVLGGEVTRNEKKGTARQGTFIEAPTEEKDVFGKTWLDVLKWGKACPCSLNPEGRSLRRAKHLGWYKGERGD